MSRARDLADRVLHNRTHEDTEGGRESIVTFKGEQSGGEISTLAQIQASHDGTADDQKADLIFKTNDGSDNNAPTESMRIDSSQNVAIGNTVPTGKLTISENSGANAPTSITADNTYLHLGSGDFGASNNGKFMIGFGYTEGQVNTNSPSYIGFEETSTSGDTKGALTFHTRDVVTDTAPTERMRILPSGGITFNGDTAAANALDDYETGTFQMSVGGVSGGARGFGIYTKIGEVVHFQWYSGAMTVTSAAPSLTGLPFTSTDPFNNGAYAGAIFYHNTYISDAATGYINLNSTSVYPTAINGTSGTINTGSSKYVMVTGTYYTNA